MPAKIGASEAKTNLPALLERVARGERFTITKHGRPIARLVPIERTGPDRRREAIERLKRFREGKPWTFRSKNSLATVGGDGPSAGRAWREPAAPATRLEIPGQIRIIRKLRIAEIL
jgi:prevent-host-death family protein